MSVSEEEGRAAHSSQSSVIEKRTTERNEKTKKKKGQKTPEQHIPKNDSATHIDDNRTSRCAPSLLTTHRFFFANLTFIKNPTCHSTCITYAS